MPMFPRHDESRFPRPLQYVPGTKLATELDYRLPYINDQRRSRCIRCQFICIRSVLQRSPTSRCPLLLAHKHSLHIIPSLLVSISLKRRHSPASRLEDERSLHHLRYVCTSDNCCNGDHEMYKDPESCVQERLGCRCMLTPRRGMGRHAGASQ
jgi:hypothetical protein